MYVNEPWLPQQINRLRAEEQINVLKKVALKRFIFGPSSTDHFPCKIHFSLDLSLKKLCTLGHIRRRTISSVDVRESRWV